MKIKKVNLDRKPLDSAYIQQKQDFQQLMSMYKKINIPVWKQPLFYGVVGFASVAAVVVSTVFDFNSKPIEKNHTQTQKEIKKDSPLKASFVAEPSTTSLVVSHVKEVTPSKEDVQYSVPPKQKSKVAVPSILAESVEMETTMPAPVLKEQKSVAIVPSIAGKSQGNIKASQLCAEEGVVMDQDTKITSFHILYSVGLRERVVSVKGSRVPEEVCKELEKSGFEQMVFITEIKGLKDEKVVALPSLNFWVIQG